VSRKKRVVVTGLGLVTPCGTGVEKVWENLTNGVSGIDKITKIDTSQFATKIAGEVKDFNPLDYIEKKEVKKYDEFIQYAIGATSEALEMSNFSLGQIEPKDIGVCVGVGLGGLRTIEEQAVYINERGPRKISPFFIPKVIGNMAPGAIAIKWGFKGPNFTVTTACASGTHAIGEAYRTIIRGDAKVMIAGGAEAVISRLAIAGFNAMKAISTRNDEPQKASRPFEKNRDGFVISEGSGIMILEDLDVAVKRNANILAEIVGYGTSADAYHVAAPAPEGEGMYSAMKMALDNAEVSPEEVEYINAHGTSTVLNDRYETAAIKRLFGDYAYKIPISSSKSMIGHMLGAAGGVEGVITILTMLKGIIHPTINYEEPDPLCDLDYVPNKKRKKNVNIALSNSFGFGGANACLLFRKFES
jgi:3-oxoacyl-[acyl-carrier-protein] synthase II